MNAYNKTRTYRCCTFYCSDCCVDKKTYRRKLFHNKWLSVTQAVEPSLIMWENLGLTKKGRCIRVIFISFISLLLLFAAAFLIFGIRYWYKFTFKQIEITCDAPISEQDDLNDPDKLHCYCKQNLLRIGTNKKTIEDLNTIFINGEKHCQDWFKK